MAEFDARKVLDSLPDAVVAADSAQRIVHAGEGVRRLLGWAPENLRGRTLAELLPPPHQEMELNCPVRVRAARPDGSTREVELTLSGDVDSLLLATLREPPAFLDGDAAPKLAAILQTIAVGVLLVEGTEGRLTVANPTAERIAGEPLRGLLYRDFVERFPLERLDGHTMGFDERPLVRTFHAGAPVREVLRYRRPDGHEFFLQVTTSPFPGPEGGAVTTFLDVTERYHLEQDSAALAAQLRALIDHLPVGVAYFDKMAVCRAGNNPARRFLGRPRSEILGSTADDLFSSAPALRDALNRCVRDHVSHVQPRVPWPDASRPGTIRYLDWQFEPLSNDPAKPRGALALITDVTERALVEAEKQRAMEAAEDASRRKTQFLSAVSHDLRTPVNALSLQAELLARIVEMRDDPDDEELQLLAGDIRAASNNLIELINDLLDLTRFDSGNFDYHPTDFDLDEWLAATLAPLELTARTKDLEFSWCTDRPGRVVRADRVKLGRVLTNLVGNAVKFTDHGEVAITVGADPDGSLRIAVRDTGPGIPPDQLDRIFDEFAQLRNPERDRTKGTGLGLAICRRLVEGVGGRMLVESQPGKGSTFTAIYPPDHLPTGPSAKPSDQYVVFPPHEGPACDSARILLVEDDEKSRTALSRLLQHAGYTVQSVPDGPRALESLRSGELPALVLLDMVLPGGMSGEELLRQIRRDPALRRLKIVVLSGDVIDAHTGELQALDADGMLAKPVDFDALSALLAEMVPLS